MKLKKKIKGVAILPTLLTLGNLLCGFWSVIYTLRSDYKSAAIMIFVSMGLDALDGRVARLTKTASNFGAQLDSLADLISFGLAPALIIYSMIHNASIEFTKFEIAYRGIIFLSAFYMLCAALRLARFNVESTSDKTSHDYFSGLPSPGAAGFIASLIILHHYFFGQAKMAGANTVLLVLPFIAVLLGFLMVSRFQYVHMLNSFSRIHPFARLLEIILATLFIAIFREITLFLIFVIYVLSGPVLYARQRLFRKPVPAGAPDEANEETIF
jgi:CDP-diacylglycerol--serine O-phosphatidyltransferase